VIGEGIGENGVIGGVGVRKVGGKWKKLTVKGREMGWERQG
jgi:hypothetical protein